MDYHNIDYEWLTKELDKKYRVVETIKVGNNYYLNFRYSVVNGEDAIKTEIKEITKYVVDILRINQRDIDKLVDIIKVLIKLSRHVDINDATDSVIKQAVFEFTRNHIYTKLLF